MLLILLYIFVLPIFNLFLCVHIYISFCFLNIKLYIYRSICDKFDVAKATALYSVRKVTKALVALAPIFITWPEDERAETVMKGFAETSAFPRVIGAIDGTHINIKAPHVNPECYVNKKNHHSIQLQVIYYV